MRWIAVFSVALVAMAWTGAEKDRGVALGPTENLPLLPLKKMGLVFPGDASRFDGFFDAWDGLVRQGKGQLDMVHIGGSHVQAGWIGHRMRERWQAHVPGCLQSRGMLMPFRQAGTNSPTHYRTEMTGTWSGARCGTRRHAGPFGGTGLRATTSEPGASWKAWTYRPDSTLYASNEVDLWVTGKAWRPVWRGEEKVDTAYRLDGTDAWRFVLDRAADTLIFGVEPENGSASESFTLHGMVARNRRPVEAGFTLHEVGNNGASTASFLRCEDISRDWKLLAPDLVVFGIGINDAHVPEERFDEEAFEARYDSLMDVIKTAHPDTRFLLLTNTDSFYKRRVPNRNALSVREAMMRLAQKHDAALFDLGEAMGGLGSIRVWHEAGYARKDLIHFTKDGYTLIGDLLFEAMLAAYGNHIAPPSS